MKVKDALLYFLKFGKENGIPDIIDNKKIFLKIIEKFGEKDTRDISTIEIAPFLKKELGITKNFLHNFLVKKNYAWEKKYYKHYVTGEISSLPWESKNPNSALVRLFNKRGLGFRPEKVLELGCGFGTNAIFMAQRGCKVTAIDISLLAIKRARSEAKKVNTSCNFLNKNIFDLKFKNESFDFIFDRGCFHHIPFFLHEAYKKIVAELLASKGYFHLICHNPKVFSMKYLYPYLGALTKVINYICEGKSESFFTEKEIYMIFSDRFRVLKVNIIHDDMGRPFDFLSCIMKKRF